MTQWKINNFDRIWINRENDLKPEEDMKDMQNPIRCPLNISKNFKALNYIQ
jgi:hypothetical protein